MKLAVYLGGEVLSRAGAGLLQLTVRCEPLGGRRIGSKPSQAGAGRGLGGASEQNRSRRATLLRCCDCGLLPPPPPPPPPATVTGLYRPSRRLCGFSGGGRAPLRRAGSCCRAARPPRRLDTSTSERPRGPGRGPVGRRSRARGTRSRMSQPLVRPATDEPKGRRLRPDRSLARQHDLSGRGPGEPGPPAPANGTDERQVGGAQVSPSPTRLDQQEQE